MTDLLKVFDEEYDFSNPIRADVFKLPKFIEFVTVHLTLTDYGIQVRKCEDHDCKFHKPIRMLFEDFRRIPLVPAPIPDSTKQHFLRLQETLIDNPTGLPDDSHQPSLIEKRNAARASAEGRQGKRSVRMTTVAGVKPSAVKIRAAVNCIECGKTRLLYSQNAISIDSLAKLYDDLEDVHYICGGPVLRSDHIFFRTLGTLADLTCNDPIAAGYYSTFKVIAKKFGLPGFVENCCFWCASIESDVSRRAPDVSAVYACLLPTCQACHDNGHNQFRITNKRKATKTVKAPKKVLRVTADRSSEDCEE
jgi:hypothetical protein